MTKNPKISVKNIKKSFGSKVVINDVNFDINSGESFVVMGGSGTGKSVLIKSIIGLMIPDQGSQVLIDGHDITFSPLSQRSEFINKSGVLFQGGALFDSLPVWQNIAFSLLERGLINKKQAKELAVEKLSQVGLKADTAELFPVELSGGMQKRVALARAIAGDPEIIFFDEPTAGLDPIMSGVISELIKSCSKKLGATTITITHDMHCARIIADSAALLFNGKFIWHGKGSDLDNSGSEHLNQFVHGTAVGPMTA